MSNAFSIDRLKSHIDECEKATNTPTSPAEGAESKPLDAVNTYIRLRGQLKYNLETIEEEAELLQRKIDSFRRYQTHFQECINAILGCVPPEPATITACSPCGCD